MKLELNWMDKAHPCEGGFSWGLPWEKGALDRNTPLYLCDEEGKNVPMQSECRAYWPDGSVKWTLHTAIDTPKGKYFISDEAPETLNEAECKVQVWEGNDRIIIDTGAVAWTIRLNSVNMIESIACGPQMVSSLGQLVLISEKRHEQVDDYVGYVQTCRYLGTASLAQFEERGPMKVVLRLRGSHVEREGGRGRRWIPFDLRLTFFAGQAEVKAVHTMLFDGQEGQDFIRGVGLFFDVPLECATFNRYVRFGGETGLFSESPRSLWMNRHVQINEPYVQQMNGVEVVENKNLMTSDMTEWNDFKISQLSSNRYDIYKRTGPGRVYVRGAAGDRAMGVVYGGDARHGLAIAKKDFWQKFPAGFEVKNMLKEKAQVVAWLYSPDGPAMDFRHYDDKTHLTLCYEGFDEMRSTAYGIANTNEMIIAAYTGFPGNDAIIELARKCQNPNLLLADVQHYVDSKALGNGVFAPYNPDTKGKKLLEKHLEDLFDYHKMQREQADMYGFWDYGDIRHTYDKIRHNWLYDMGGYAWQNTELIPNIWLWYNFLRTQRVDYFQWASAMTRHTSEVDVYHLGSYKSLGTRHNVLHWGCGCKENRVGLSQMNKAFYYLTGDTRTGEILTESKDVDFAVARLDPLRAYYSPDPDYPCHIRFGPDVMVFCGNWLTQYERTEDPVYRDKILRMLDHFRGLGDFAAASVWLYDPITGNMKRVERNVPSHFNFCFGAEFVWSEVLTSLGDEQLWQNFLDMGLVFSKNGAPDGAGAEWDGVEMSIENKLLAASSGVTVPVNKRGNVEGPRDNIRTYSCGVAAYAAGHCGDDVLAEQVWRNMLIDETNAQHDAVAVPVIVRDVNENFVHKPWKEAGFVTGNGSGLWGSHAIVVLANIGDKLPKSFK